LYLRKDKSKQYVKLSIDYFFLGVKGAMSYRADLVQLIDI